MRFSEDAEIVVKSQEINIEQTDATVFDTQTDDNPTESEVTL
jgi:hypothetical protein